jgi:hypothetical protein
VSTLKKYLIVDFVDHIITEAAHKKYFTSMRIKCVEFQNNKVYLAKRDVAAANANPALQSTISKILMNGYDTLEFNYVIPCEFPSRFLLLNTFVRRIMDLLPFF